ncbi:MAG: uroporphyrinogen decarboxylase family protein [Planctomycetota bacterium]
MSLSHQERILRTMRGEPVDRIPIGSPISWSPQPPRNPNARDIWADDPNYQAVLPLVEEHCDAFGRSGAIGFDRGNLQIPRKYIKGESVREGKRVKTTNYIDTPKGKLRRVAEREDGIHTVWVTEPLIKDKSDVEKILSVPYEFEAPDYGTFFEERERLGDRGVMEVGVSVPLVSISHMFHFDEFLLWCAAERGAIKLLISTVFERIYDRLERVLKEGVGPAFWLGGSEQATPPMMSPALYDELSIGYDRQLFDLIHKYGGIVHVHCHGKVSGVLDKLVEAGVDFLDPVEPPPQGDITMEEAKRRVNGKIVLMGNIEFRDLEFDTPDQIDRKVRDAILPGGRKHMLLYPSATPIMPMTDKYRDNAIQYMESALEYGKMDGEG